MAKLRVLPFNELSEASSESLALSSGIYDVRNEKLVGVAFKVVSPILLNCNISNFLCDIHNFKDDTASIATLYNKGDMLYIPLDDLELFLGLPEFNNKAIGGEYKLDITNGVDKDVISKLPKIYFNRKIDRVIITARGCEAFRYLV